PPPGSTPVPYTTLFRSAQRFRAALSLTLEEHVSLADQQETDVRGGRQVTAGTERALLRHPGVDVAIQQLHQSFGDLRAHARRALDRKSTRLNSSHLGIS